MSGIKLLGNAIKAAGNLLLICQLPFALLIYLKLLIGGTTKLVENQSVNLLALHMPGHSRQVKHNFNVYKTDNFLIHTLVEGI